MGFFFFKIQEFIWTYLEHSYSKSGYKWLPQGKHGAHSYTGEYLLIHEVENAKPEYLHYFTY